MSKIQDAIVELRRAPGVKGAAVVTRDGLVAASALDASTGPDVVAGLASYLLMSTNRCLSEGGLSPCESLTIFATNGRTRLVSLDDACLVVMFDQFSEPSKSDKDVAAAVASIRRAYRLS